MAYTLTDYDAMMKDHYTDEKVKVLSYGDNPLFGLLRKKKKGGRKYIQPVGFGHPGGTAANFAKAKTNQYGSKFDDFQITRKKQYLFVTLDNELYVSSQDDMDAFEPAFDEFDKGFKSLGEKINRRLYRTSTGAIGQILAGSSIAAAVATLADKADAFNFEPGMKVVFSATNAGAGSLLDAGQALTVSSVDLEAGTVTFTENLSEITGISDDEYMFQEGDWNDCPAGLESWLPVTNRSTNLAASFFGVTRSQSPDRLGGIYMDGTTMGDLNEVVIKLVGKVGKHGGKVDLIVMNTEVFTDLQLLWHSKHFIYEQIDVSVRERVGDRTVTFTNLYSGMRATIGDRRVTLIGDRACPSNRLYALQSDTWTVWHSYDLPGFLNKPATGEILRVPDDSDDVECRVGGYFNLGCSAPGFNGVASLPVN